MKASLVSLLPFLQALQRKPGTPQYQNESKPSPAQAKPAQIPLGGAPPAPGVPANAFDQARIKSLTVEQVANVIFHENGTGKYKVEPLPGRSTAADLHAAKTAQGRAVINGDLRFGKKRPQTAGSETTEAERKTPEYQQALAAARDAFQEYKFGHDRTQGRVMFGNRFENDVGKNEEKLWDDRIVRSHGTPIGTEKVFHVYGPFTAHGGKVWTHIFDDMRPIKKSQHAPAQKTGHPIPGGKNDPVK